MPLDDIRKIGHVLLEAVDLHLQTKEELKELHDFRSNREALQKEFDTKQESLRVLEEAFSQKRSEFAVFKKNAEEHRQKVLQTYKVDIEAQRASLVMDYQKAAKELEEATIRARSEQAQALNERNAAQRERDIMQKDLSVLREKFGIYDEKPTHGA